MFRWLLATGIAAATYLIFARNQDDNDDDLYEQIIEQHVSHAKSKTTYHLYACGSNQYGELGIASVRAYKETFTLVKLPENLQDIHLQSNIFGGYMYLQAKQFGKKYLFGVGDDTHGQIGFCEPTRPDQKLFIPKFYILPISSNVHHYACGSTHALVVTDKGSILGVGTNRFGELGSFSSLDRQSTFTPIFTHFDPQTRVRCGINCSAILIKGRVFCTGTNLQGQCGSANLCYLYHLTPVEMEEYVLDVFCGYDCMFLLSMSRDLFACGNNSGGKLGVGSNHDRVIGPQVVALPGGVNVESICMTEQHAFILTVDHRMYITGKDKSLVPMPLDLPRLDVGAIAQLACLKNAAVILTEARQIWLCKTSSDKCALDEYVEEQGRLFEFQRCNIVLESKRMVKHMATCGDAIFLLYEWNNETIFWRSKGMKAFTDVRVITR